MEKQPDPFAPPEAQGGVDLELDSAGKQPKPESIGTMAQDGGQAHTRSAPDTVAAPHKPLKYKKPGGGYMTLLILFFCLAGFFAVGFQLWKKFVHDADAPKTSVGRALPAAAPAKPTEYKALNMGSAVLVDFKIQPAKARRSAKIYVDGEPIQSNPTRIKPGAGTHFVVVTADGFAASKKVFTVSEATTVTVKLQKAP